MGSNKTLRQQLAEARKVIFGANQAGAKLEASTSKLKADTAKRKIDEAISKYSKNNKVSAKPKKRARKANSQNAALTKSKWGNF